MTLPRSFVRPLVRPLVRSGAVGPYGGATYQDGIHLNFASGNTTSGYYVKAVGAAPTVSPLTSLFTFTGGNQSMYMGPAGLLVASATNTPRIEYGPGGDVLGLLMEAARTNLWLRSQEWSDAQWVKLRSSTSANTVAAPDGTTTADTLIEDGSAATTHLIRQDLNVTSGTSYTATFWAKAAGRSQVSFQFGSENGCFAFEAGLFTLSGAGTAATLSGSPLATSIQAFPNGWYRCRVSATAAATALAGLRLFSADGGTTTYNGDGASGVYLWGAQLEAGAFPSSYIPTTTGSVARTADSCIRTLGSEFSATAGTVVVNVSDFISADVTANNCIASLDDATANERLTLQRTNTAGAMRLNVFDGGVNQAAIDGLSAISTAGVRLAYAFAANDFAISGNGGAIATDAAGTLPTVTRLDLGSRLTGEHLFGHILRFDYYPTRLPNTYLVSAST